MKKMYKGLITLAVCLVFTSLLIGYAVVNDDLNIFGSLSVDGVTIAELTTGENLNAELDKCAGVTRIIFDRYVNQASALNYAGLSWNSESAVDVQSENSAPGSVKLFWDSANTTVYILSKDSLDLIANSDCSGMFASDDAETSTVETIYFNTFDTSNTTDMSNMFKNCSSLTTIFAKADFNTDKTFPDGEADNSADMFVGCYVLAGGEGTAVYPDGTGSTTQPTGCTYARIDDGVSKPGYFTDSTAEDIVYLRSNLLKSSDEISAGASATYEINGISATYTLSNAIDSKIYSRSEMSYTIVTYVEVDGDWKTYSSKNHTFYGNAYYTENFEVTPITDENGVTYDKIKILAQCTTGQLESLEGIFEFNYSAHETSYEYDGSAIILTLATNDIGGEYTFTWESGIAPDNSDSNLVFTDVQSGDSPYTATLSAYTTYKFYFFVTDIDTANDIANDNTLIEMLVTVAKS